MLTFQLRLEPSSERSVQSPFAAQFRDEQDVVDVGELVRLSIKGCVFNEFHFELVYRSTYEYI